MTFESAVVQDCSAGMQAGGSEQQEAASMDHVMLKTLRQSRGLKGQRAVR